MKAASLLVAAAVGLIAATDVTGSWEHDKSCPPARTQDILHSLDQFEAAARGSDVEAIIAHYSPDAILMDAAEQAVRLGRREIADYYSVQAEGPRTETMTRTLDTACSIVSITGTQRLSWSGTRATATLRYRYSLAQTDGRWLIIHHHTSLIDGALPELPKAVAKPLNRTPLTTGSTKPRATALPPTPPEPLTLPPASFTLPQTPPVFIRSERPELLSAPRARANNTERQLVLPPLPDRLLGDLPSALLPPRQAKLIEEPHRVVPPLPPAVLVQVPSLPIARPEPVTAASFAPPTTLPSIAATNKITVPPLGITIGTFPALAPVSSAPRPTEPQPTRAPAVASFSKRIVPEPPAIAAPPPKRAAQAKAEPAAKTAAALPKAAAPAKSSGWGFKPGRWVDSLPVFD